MRNPNPAIIHAPALRCNGHHPSEWDKLRMCSINRCAMLTRHVHATVRVLAPDSSIPTTYGTLFFSVLVMCQSLRETTSWPRNFARR